MDKAWETLRSTVIQCTRCPRLVAFREQAPVKKGCDPASYWRRPVPGNGDPEGWLLITGLAPSAQGGNRTGRIFTGDQSGRFLVKALYAEGFANQPFSESRDDGLLYKGCYVTVAVKCVPPYDKPDISEIANCSSYYEQEIALLKNLTSILTLGQVAFQAFLRYAKRVGISTRGMKFQHGGSYDFPENIQLFASYHPSPQNVNTGRLTEKMFLEVLRDIKKSHKQKTNKDYT